MRYTNIQALRFGAAVAIVMYHLGQQSELFLGISSPLIDFLKNDLWGLGVYVFFAISGFVLALSLRTTSVREFLVWRMARLYLPYWAVVASVVVGAWAVGDPFQFDRRLLNSLLLTPSGASRGAYCLGGLEWTLIFEVFFGVALGLCALAGRHGVTSGATLWLGACLFKAVVYPTGVNAHPVWGAILLSPINVPFLLGVLTCELRGRALVAARLIAPLAAFVLVAVGRGTPVPDVALSIQGAGAAAVVVWFVAARQLDAANPLVRYGDWSYGVYLCHFCVLKSVFRFVIPMGWVPAAIEGVVTTGAVALTAGLGFGWLESNAYRWLRHRYATKRPALAVAAKRAA